MQVGDLVKLIPPYQRLNDRKVLGIVVAIVENDCPIVQWSVDKLPSWEEQELIEVVSSASR